MDPLLLGQICKFVYYSYIENIMVMDSQGYNFFKKPRGLTILGGLI